jgi:predicted RNA-binding Zn-ribbon protein involved in translation (DUF1610 family)
MRSSIAAHKTMSSWPRASKPMSDAEFALLGPANLHMPRKEKIHLEKVQAALNTVCPKCGYSITPAEIRRVSFDTMKCPKCGEIFRRDVK